VEVVVQEVDAGANLLFEGRRGLAVARPQRQFFRRKYSRPETGRDYSCIPGFRGCSASSPVSAPVVVGQVESDQKIFRQLVAGPPRGILRRR